MGFKPIPAAVALALTLLIWFVIPVPQGVSPDAWHLLALFVGVIAGIIGKAMPIGAMAILGITLVALTGVTNEKAADATQRRLEQPQQLTHLDDRYRHHHLARPVENRLGYAYRLPLDFPLRQTHAGRRLQLGACRLGHRSGNAKQYRARRCDRASDYEIHRTELRLRSRKRYGGKIGKYLSLVNFHSNVITCLIFITATAPNPLVVNWLPKPPIRKSNSLGVLGSWRWSYPACLLCC